MGRAGGFPSFRPTRLWIWPALLILATLSFWVLFLGQAEKSVFGRVPILDEVYYLDRAAAWTGDATSPGEAFFVSPLYPLMISWAGGGDPVQSDRVIPPDRLRGVRLWQIGCWCGVLVLLRLTAGRILGQAHRDRAAGLLPWLPSLLFALYMPAAVYAVSILLELPLVLLVSAAVYLMVLGQGPGDTRRHLLLAASTGLVIGLAGLLRGTALVLVLPAAVVYFQAARRGKTRFGGVLLLAAVAGLVQVPAVTHNSRLAGRLAPPTLNAGVNLYIGNGTRANGFYVAVVPGDWRRDPAGREFLGERMGTPPPSLAEADGIWRREAVQSMKDDPGRAAALWARKVWLHLQGWEIDQLTPLDRWRQAAPALGLLPVPFALLVVLGLGGVVAKWSDPRVRVIGAALVLLVAFQSLFFVVSRYRLVLVPLLCLLTTGGVVELLKRNRRIWVACGVAVVLAVPWGLGETRELWAAQGMANEARRWAEIGLADESSAALDRAEELYTAAVAGLSGRDGGPAPWLGLASLKAARGATGEAVEILREGARNTSGHLSIHKALLAQHLENGDRAQALDLTATILADHPRDADTLHNRTILLAERNEVAAAAAAARLLVAYHPDDPRGYVDLGIILARAGRQQEARAVFEKGLAAVPGHPDLLENLAILDR
jgi:hypothetical protein